MSMFEQREVDGPNNVGLFALEDIPKDKIISRESPFYAFNKNDLLLYMTSANPTGNLILDEEIRDLQNQIKIANEQYLRQKSSFNNEYPPISF